MEKWRIGTVLWSIILTVTTQARADSIEAPLADTQLGGILPTGESSIDLKDTASIATVGMARARVIVVSSSCRSPMVFVLPAVRQETSRFGFRRDPVHGGWRLHQGIDMAAPLGSPVLAAKQGVVLQSEWAQGYGNLVVINHGEGVTTRYAHLERSLVHSGESISAGQKIGLVGATGHATGTHLHFEIRQGERAVNPAQASLSFCDPASPRFANDLAIIAPRLDEVSTRLAWTDTFEDTRLPTNLIR